MREGVSTWRWTDRLPGVKATVVLNRTAHFSSVTDSDPFRSQRLIFFSSYKGRAEHQPWASAGAGALCWLD